MTALRVTDASGSVGVLQASDGLGNFLPTGILFNTASAGLDSSYSLGTDVSIFVTGSVDSKDTSTKGVTLFAGDIVVSGTLYAEKQVIEVDELAPGHLLVSGSLFASGTIASAQGIEIGPAEDGAYTDGLFTDLSIATPIGTVVDRFNEILKSLAPGPSPALDDIDHNNASVTGKLSFGTANAVGNYTNSNTTAGFSAVNVDGTYGSSISGNNLRIGLLDGATDITGDLNEDVASDTYSNNQVNYAANSFGDASSGTLKLYVNGLLKHSVVLTGSNDGHVGTGVPGSGTASSLNANSSGFTHLSSTGSATFSDGSTLDLFQHRTGRYKVDVLDQRLGWNYANVVHSLSSGDVNTNYIEWVNDTDSNALSASGAAFDTLSMTGNVSLSGVKYHTGGTAQYRVRVSNAYKNVYSTSNITFTDTNCAISNQSIPSSGNDEDKILHITGSATINVDSLLVGTITAKVNVPHPLKANLSNAGTQSISNLLLWDYSNNSTVLAENFRRENYRIVSGSYSAQSSAVNANNTWNSSKHMSGSNTGHDDGLMFYNHRLYAPRHAPNSNNGNFGGIANGPAGNVDYSGITSGIRTFYRYFQNTSGGSKTGFALTVAGSGTIVTIGTVLDSSKIKVFIKLPTTAASQATGWMDLASSFATGQVGNNAGCLAGSLDSNVDSNGAENTVTFGTQFVSDDEYVVIKVIADASFTGYISSLTVDWS